MNEDVAARLAQLLTGIEDAEARQSLTKLAEGVAAMLDAGMSDGAHIVGLVQFLLGWE